MTWRSLAAGEPTDPLRGGVVFECVGVPGVLGSIIVGCERGGRIFSWRGRRRATTSIR